MSGPTDHVTCPKCSGACYAGTLKKHGHCSACEDKKVRCDAKRDVLLLAIVRADVMHNGLPTAANAKDYAARAWAVADALAAGSPT